MKRTGWKAEEWRGKINRVAFVKAKLTVADKEAGLTVFDVYGDPLGYCAICGAPLYHHWEFAREDGSKMVVGQECAAVVLGKSPASYLKNEAERRAADEAFAREDAARASAKSWWRAPERRDLRRAVVVGYRTERRLGSVSEFYARAWKAARAGALSPAFAAWVLRASDGDAHVAATRTATALRQLSDLLLVRSNRFDGSTILDLADWFFPRYDDRKIYGPIVSVRQSEMIAKMHKRYSKQLKATSA